MKPSAIKISNTSDGILSVDLKDILQCINDGSKYHWSILWLEAIGKLEDVNVLSFEAEVKRAESGLVINWDDLLKISTRFNQIIEIILIGDLDPSKLRRYGNDDQMHEACDFTIELIDSSYWIINSKNEELLSPVKRNIKGAINI
jgi:hypothetical protein